MSGGGIERFALAGQTRARAATFNRMIVTVSTARASSSGVEAQSREVLRALDTNLRVSGSDKSRLLFVLVFLADIATKPEFNRAWDEWVDRLQPPVRACVGAQLENGDLVECVAVAATCDDKN